MTTEQSLFPLKTLVFSLAVLLLGGIMLLGGTVYKRMDRGDCRAGVDLSARGKVLEVRPEGREVRVVFKNQSGMEVVRLDACTGKEKGSLLLKTE